MKKAFFFLAFFTAAFFSGCSSNDDGLLDFNGKKYELTFSDDFESGKLDTTKWRYSPEMERQDAGGWWKKTAAALTVTDVMPALAARRTFCTGRNE